MSSVNKVMILGRLGADPETRSSPSGLEICNLSIATNHYSRDQQSGERRESTEWHRVVLFGRQAEIAGQYLRKGSLAFIEGRLQTRKWTDRDGIDRWSTEIVGENLRLIGGRQDSEWGGSYGDDFGGGSGGYGGASSGRDGYGGSRVGDSYGSSRGSDGFESGGQAPRPPRSAPAGGQGGGQGAGGASGSSGSSGGTGGMPDLGDLDDDIPF